MADSCTGVSERNLLICIEIWLVVEESSTRSLYFNKYGYVHGDPVQFSDPLGLWSYFGELGKVSHKLISNLYKDSHPGDAVTYGKQVPGTGGAILPDVINFSNGTIGEIKPLSVSGVLSGYVQLTAAIQIANGIEWRYEGEDYKVDPVPNLANTRWKADSWSPGVRVLFPTKIDPYWKDDLIVTVGNFNGVIIYKRVKLPSGRQTKEVLEKIVKTTEEMVKVLDVSPDGRLDPSTLDVTTQLITVQIDLIVLSYVFGTLAAAGLGVGIGAALSSATMTSSFGFAM